MNGKLIYAPRETAYCDYCGKKIEDTNDTGTLCYRCYMKEYYG